MTSSHHHARVSPLAAGLGCRCPRCGQGRLFDGFLTVQDRCERCGLDLKSADSGDGPAVFLIFILGFLVVPAALLFESWVEPPLWVHAVLWGVVILGGAIAMLRPFKATMIALQYRHKASDSGSTRYEP
ncbi:DUF983 domain-containing protein [Aquibaculum arenosum]|uniref:DUF983 domain-containing protein n=1 Tax=Aquibaculum arenosum TaxID=3032591 RepID=A0ABT5YM80_9PROT|nr:DUF983 domain-containing protein [Fodinicurvata sp. CAU 1616]MDF2095936.1 DUF983 domain-containing protein [Fodinicurvata sp. CAU 1616]